MEVSSNLIKVGSNIGTWNLRGLKLLGGPGADGETQSALELLHHVTVHGIGVVMLQEVHSLGIQSSVIPDIFHDYWELRTAGPDQASELKGQQGTGFLVGPKYEVLDYDVFSPRVSCITLRVRGDKHARPVCLISAYAPTEAATAFELELFYLTLANAWDHCVKRSGHDPIVGGDFNVNVGEDHIDKTTGFRTRGLPSSRNCGLLYTFCRARRIVILNTWFGRTEAERATWYHPRTRKGHLKDLFLVPIVSLGSFMTAKPVHSANCGNNDHSLVVAEVKNSWGWRNRVKSFATNNRFQGTREGARPQLMSADDLFRKKGRRKDVSQLELMKGEYQQRLNAKLGLHPGGDWMNTKNAMQEALLETLPDRTLPPLPHHWRDLVHSQLTNLFKQVGEVRAKLLGEPESLALKARSIHLKRELKRVTKEGKKAFERALLADLTHVSRRRRKRAKKVLAGEEGSKGRTDSEVTPEQFGRHFEQLFGRSSETMTLDLEGMASVGQIQPKSRVRQDLSGPPTWDEVGTSIRHLKSGKAAGVDGLPPEAFKAAGDSLVSRLVEDYRAIWPSVRARADDTDGQRAEQLVASVYKGWRDAEVVTIFKKGSRTDPGNYRGIFLLEIAGKILAGVLCRRLSNLVETYVADTQCGFRKRRGTTHAILSIRRVQAEVRRAGVPTAAAFVDFTKAFDSVPREALWECLAHIGCPADLLAVLCAIHENPQARVQGSTMWFNVSRGVRQGCNLGPTLFIILLDFCLRKAGLGEDEGIEFVCKDLPDFTCPADIKNLEHRTLRSEYADDIFILAGSTAELQSKLERLRAACAPIGLDISVTKTEWMWLYQSEDLLCQNQVGVGPCCDAVKLGGSVVRHVNKFVYLGSLLCTSGDISEEIRTRISLGDRCLHDLDFFWRSDLSRRDKVRLLESKVFPVLLYASETWNMTVPDYERLEAFLNRCRLRILGRKRLVDFLVLSNEELQRLVYLPSIADLVVPRRISFILRTIYDPSAMQARRLIFSECRKGKKVSGRDRSNFTKTIRADMCFLLAVAISRHEKGKTLPGMEELISQCRSEAQPWRVWEVLGTKMTMPAGRYGVKRLFKKIFGKRSTGEEPKFPSLLSARPRVHGCDVCDAFYVERKGLLRHQRDAHAEPIVDRVDGTQEAVMSSKGFDCPHCSCTYKTKGWLTRHLKDKHRAATQCLEVSESPGNKGDATVEKRHGVRQALGAVKSKSINGLVCEICGKYGKQPQGWSEKSAKNHYAKEHQLNWPSMAPSRVRKGKTGGAVLDAGVGTAIAGGGPVVRADEAALSLTLDGDCGLQNSTPSACRGTRYTFDVN